MGDDAQGFHGTSAGHLQHQLLTEFGKGYVKRRSAPGFASVAVFLAGAAGRKLPPRPRLLLLDRSTSWRQVLACF